MTKEERKQALIRLNAAAMIFDSPARDFLKVSDEEADLVIEITEAISNMYVGDEDFLAEVKTIVDEFITDYTYLTKGEIH